MTLQKYHLRILSVWANALCSIVTYLRLVGCLVAFVIIGVVTVGHTQEVTEKITDQPSYVFVLSTKSNDKPEKTDSIHFTFL